MNQVNLNWKVHIMIAYRLLTHEDTSAFCHKVTKAISNGWELYGDPQYTYDEKWSVMRCAQAVIKKNDIEYKRELKLSEL